MSIFHRPYSSEFTGFTVCAAIVYTLPSISRACGITTLENETWDETVKYGIVIVPIECELEEITGSEGDLLSPEFEGNITGGGMEDAGGGGLGFEVIE
jgi:hypothetical protein